jgi:hypothetical protein
MFGAVPSTWATIKALVDAGERLQYVLQNASDPEAYDLVLANGAIRHHYEMVDDDADFTEFKDDYYPDANKPASPKTKDGRPFQSVDQFPKGTKVTFSGQADDFANGLVGNGVAMKTKFDTAANSEFTLQFVEPVYLAGGRVSWLNAEYGDFFCFAVKAPASPCTSNTGAGAYDKYDVGGGLNMFIPNGTVTGDWDLNLTECHPNLSTSEVTFQVTKVTPVPSSAGFFDMDITTGAVTLNPTQTGAFNLFDADVVMIHHVNKIHMMGDAERTIQGEYKTETMWPHWQMDVTVHKDAGVTGTDLEFTAELYMSRRQTVPGRPPL